MTHEEWEQEWATRMVVYEEYKANLRKQRDVFGILTARIKELEKENAMLRTQLGEKEPTP